MLASMQLLAEQEPEVKLVYITSGVSTMAGGSLKEEREDIGQMNILLDGSLSRQEEELLIDEVRRHRFTTAHLAAELLGLAGVERAIPGLRDALDSTDYMVSAKTAIALAQLDDRESIRQIESLLEPKPWGTRVTRASPPTTFGRTGLTSRRAGFSWAPRTRISQPQIMTQTHSIMSHQSARCI